MKTYISDLITGETAKHLFEKVTHLPNEILGRIWNLADTEQKGELSLTEFIIAMHLIASYREGSLRALPQILPVGLYEAASRRGAPRPVPGSRPSSGIGSANSITRQFSGSGTAAAPISAGRLAYQQSQLSMTRPSDDWAVNSRDKEEFDRFFSTVDTTKRGFITGDQAVVFFRNSKLPEDALAQIWDLADINSVGRLSRDEFAVAMFLIRQQRTQRDGRDVIPETLPQNLVPPSMRQQSRPPQPIIPSFDNSVNPTASKPASEDLFGLDTWATPAPQIPQTTGDSDLYSATPPPVQGSPQQKQPAQPPLEPQSSSAFKPFIPSSMFGQAMMTPQATDASPQSRMTGFPVRSSSATNKTSQPKSPMNDLLGDNDPEVSRKLTQETTELANLSNQVSNLTGQMQTVKINRMSTEQDLSNAQSQKREFEGRLSQLRSAYEQEVMGVKALEEQLSFIRIENKKLNQDMALVSGSYQDLQNQRGQLEKDLQQDQRENNELKERIRQTNVEINELRPQLEKMKSDARQQKGLVAINKKQLATNDTESAKLRGEVEDVSRQVEDAKREVKETAQLLESRSDAKEHSATMSPTMRPTSSTASMNPFFRQAPSVASEKSMGSPFTNQPTPSSNHNAFETFFGPSPIPTHSQTGPPLTSFKSDPFSGYNEPQQKLTSAHSVKSSEGPDLQTPSESPPPSTYNSTPQLAGEPPAPPQSRQITSSILPMRFPQRSESTSSSVKVIPPASRVGEPSDFDTPTERQTSFSAFPEPDVLRQRLDVADTDLRDNGGQENTQPDTEQGLPSIRRDDEDENKLFRTDEPDIFGKPNSFQEIPGAFPAELSLQSQSHNDSNTLPKFSKVSSNKAHDLFPGANEQSQSPGIANDDLDAAFNDFGKAPKDVSAPSSNFNAEASQSRGEFPPIQDIEADEESDTDSDRGFDDNFTVASPPRQLKIADEAQSSFPKKAQSEINDNHLAPSRPPMTTSESNQSQLPTPGAQSSPPTYDQTVAPNGQAGKRRDSNQFPAEYIGLLPSREILNTPPRTPPSSALGNVGSPAGNEKFMGIFGGPMVGEPLGGSTSYSEPLPLAPGASAAPYAYDHKAPLASQPQPLVPAKTAIEDDFDKEFGDLSEAKEADDKVEDEFGSTRKDGFDEFNPVFDSPAPTRSFSHPSSHANQSFNNFNEFESNIAASSIAPKSRQTVDQTSLNQNSDWDAIFAGLETNQKNGLQPEFQDSQGSSAEKKMPQAGITNFESSKPAMSRVISTGTDHDDPILKRLTGMGYPRETSLKALEKFDYNIDKVSLAAR